MTRYLLVLVLSPVLLTPQSDLKGEVTFSGIQAWGQDNNPGSHISFRYIPTWSAGQPETREIRVDLEIAGKFYLNNNPAGTEFTLAGDWAAFHRCWVRVTSDRFEARLGLQKITFGSARLFRTLMWFDTIDPRDPLQYTAGVSGLRLRYDCASNAGIWLWGVYDKFEFDQLIDDVEQHPQYGG
ncbi:MAG: hypothetical protein ABIA75_04555, partial [Candidatus Neomarinimicrobiota bacterium]